VSVTDDARPSGDASTTDPPEEVFSVLGDETRLRILLELADRSAPEQVSPVTSFAELRRAVGVPDAGRFSYHLEKLRDTFVRKEEDGYRPTVAGLHVASSVHAGRYGGDAADEAERLDGDCPICAEPLVARYEDDLAKLACDGGHTLFAFPVPAGAADGRSAGQLLDVAQRRATVNIEVGRNGVCPRCWGIATTTLQPEEGQYEELGVAGPSVDVECERCWLAYTVPVALAVARSPPVVAFYHDRGLDPQDAIASRDNVLARAQATLDATDPPRATVTLALDGARLVLEVEERCSIETFERA